jgi:hypothetical protein
MATSVAVAAATAAAAKANDDDDNGGGGKSNGDIGGGGGGGSGGGGGGGSGGGDDNDDDDEDNDGDGDYNRLAHNDQNNGGRRGPPAPWGRTAAALSSPSGQAPFTNANAPKQVTWNSTNVLTYAPLSSVEDGGTMEPSASSLLAVTVAPNSTSTTAANADSNADNILCKT